MSTSDINYCLSDWTMRGMRGDSAVLTAAGVAAVAAYLWFPYRVLLIAVGVVAVLVGVMLVFALRRGRDWHRQDVLIGRLRAVVRRIPSGYVLTDPGAGAGAG